MEQLVLNDILKRNLELSSEEASFLVSVAEKLAQRGRFDLGEFARLEVLRHVSDLEFVMTDDCNLQCKYCCVDATPVTRATSFMEAGLFRKAVDLVFRSSRSPRMMIVFRGGEPLLAPLPWYKEAVRYAKEAAQRQGKLLRVSYVTNGTLINEDWIDFFLEEDIGVCISIDGPPDVNDQVRGRGRRIARNMKRLAERGKSFGGITVLTRVNYDKMPETLEFLLSLGVQSHKFNAAYPLGRPAPGEEWLTPEQHLRAKTDIFRTMLEHECRIVDAALMDQVSWFVEPGAPRKKSCYAFECGAGRQLLLVNTRGDLYPCDRAYKDIPVLGNLHTGIDPEAYQRALETFHYKDVSWSECLQCPAARTCGHGCAAYYHTARRGGIDDFDCVFNKLLHQFFQENRESVHQLYRLYRESRTGRAA